MIRYIAVAENSNLRDAGDALQQLGDRQLEDSKTNARLAYGGAKGLYVQYVAKLAPGPLPPDGAAPERPEIARAYIEAAATTTKLARITGSEDDLKQAASLASAAVLYSPNGKLKAYSWAALGAAANEAGDVAVAVPAYRSAVTQGATAPWVSKDLQGAKSDLGKRPEVKLNKGFLASHAREAID